MRVLLLAAIGAIALLEASAPCAGSGLAGPRLRPVHMVMPSVEERRAGARPHGGIRRSGQRAGSAAPYPSYAGPKVPQPENAGVATSSKNASVTIHNGSQAKPGQFPWQLAVNIDEQFFCGGSIIAEQWVLTAAHCVQGALKFTITAGSLSYENGKETTKQIVTATKYFRHPDYNPVFIDNDIGIIQPSTAFTWNENVKPIRLPSYAMGEDMMTGKTATISGWGITDDGYFPEQPTNLLFTQMVINDGGACYNYYGNVWIPTKICFDTKKDQNSTCQGDSGGPLIIQEADGKWTEIGLTSFGASAGCAQGLPVAFTRVASFLKFIETTTNIAVRD